MDAAAGLGALGFWIFVAAIVVAGIWYDARQKETQQETLRRVVESGRDIDQEVIDRVLGVSDSKELARDLKLSFYIILGAAAGLLALGLFLGAINADARVALMGVSALVASIGAGLWVAAKFVERGAD
ncbi:MAG: DUF6249 domain-containing protein [Woeseiaceae bacterium]|nr:DUF6249 domain-containing protein [Woeseiaceae bacterium]